MFRNVLSDNHRKLLHTTKSPGNHKNFLLSKKYTVVNFLQNQKINNSRRTVLIMTQMNPSLKPLCGLVNVDLNFVKIKHVLTL